MAKLFLFGIGGTGSRVIRAFTMLMAAGVKIQNCDKIVPIIIDPDSQNGDMNRTVELLKTYKRIHNHLGNRPEGFFHKDIATLASVAGRTDGNIPDSFVYNFSGKNKSFREFINYTQLSVDSKAMVDLLFTEENLSNSLDVGFRGSPNVGSVVLNDVMNSDMIRYFATNFQQGDRVFFISSIFGGTGAAGFPLLLKNFRDPNSGLPNSGYLNHALMGAITVLPYFSLEQPAADGNPETKDYIDSNSFITKTKDALSYYQNNLQSLNALYYIGDTPEKPLENHPGRAAQQNEAHLIELLSALAIIDFMDYSPDQLQGEMHFHEYGLKEDAKDIHFTHLGTESKEKIAKDLIRFNYFDHYITEHAPQDSDAPYFKATNLGSAMRNEPIFKELQQFLRSPQYGFHAWLQELRQNKRAFEAINPDEKDFNRMVADKTIETSFFDTGLKPKTILKEIGNLNIKETEPDTFKRVIKIMEGATKNMVEEKLKYQ
ncbi:hypothetical protein [Adhaeribacter terreus]|uniref:Tubulin/FtsZ family, GTPase domain n=1 Tax=Adhaeribacter terreus TaxID=529703 RepID=A0ABW0EC93_9BACT